MATPVKIQKKMIECILAGPSEHLWALHLVSGKPPHRARSSIFCGPTWATSTIGRAHPQPLRVQQCCGDNAGKPAILTGLSHFDPSRNPGRFSLLGHQDPYGWGGVGEGFPPHH